MTGGQAGAGPSPTDLDRNEGITRDGYLLSQCRAEAVRLRAELVAERERADTAERNLAGAREDVDYHDEWIDRLEARVSASEAALTRVQRERDDWWHNAIEAGTEALRGSGLGATVQQDAEAVLDAALPLFVAEATRRIAAAWNDDLGTLYEAASGYVLAKHDACAAVAGLAGEVGQHD